MKGVILTNAYKDIPQTRSQCARLKEELEKLHVSIDIMRNDFFAANITSGGEIASKLSGYDFCIYLDKDKYISYRLEKAGIRLFNSAQAIELCDDKMTTALALSNSGIPIPKTLPGLLCYDESTPLNEQALHIVEEELGYPVIVKSSFGSMGTGVFKAENFEQLKGAASALKMQPHLFQQYIAESAGRDIRVIVIGGKAVAAMERISGGDFRSNIAIGGRGLKIDMPVQVKEMAEKAAALLNLDYCGADILFGKEGFYLCEVNSNAFFDGIEAATGVNIAKLYANHIVESMIN